MWTRHLTPTLSTGEGEGMRLKEEIAPFPSPLERG